MCIYIYRMTFYINFSIRIYDRKLLFNKQQSMHASEVRGRGESFQVCQNN